MGAPCAAPEEEYGAREGGGGEAGTKAAGKTFAAVRAHGRGRAGDERGGERDFLTIFLRDGILLGRKRRRGALRCGRAEGNRMVIEFYGEISDYTMRRADRLKKRQYSIYFFVLGALLGALAAISGAAGGEFVTLTVFAAVLCGAGFFLVFGPMKKKIKNKVRCRVRIEGDSLTWEQFLPEKTITKVKKLNRVKRVVKTDFCYFVVFNDIGNAVICERCLLKKGTFTAFESLFAGKIREKEM